MYGTSMSHPGMCALIDCDVQCAMALVLLRRLSCWQLPFGVGASRRVVPGQRHFGKEIGDRGLASESRSPDVGGERDGSLDGAKASSSGVNKERKHTGVFSIEQQASSR